MLFWETINPTAISNLKIHISKILQENEPVQVSRQVFSSKGPQMTGLFWYIYIRSRDIVILPPSRDMTFLVLWHFLSREQWRHILKWAPKKINFVDRVSFSPF